MTTLTSIEGQGLPEDQIVAEAYEYVEEGYRRALSVRGLPKDERDRLQRMLLAAGEIAHKERLRPVGGDA
jgi:hypothetical protein